MRITSSEAWLISMVVGLGAYIWDACSDGSELALLYTFIGGLTTFYGYRRYKLKVTNNNEKDI